MRRLDLFYFILFYYKQVVLCKKDHPSHERVVAAETIAYLTEVNTDLQRLASISNQLIPTLASMLHTQAETNNNASISHPESAIQADMKQAAFRVRILFEIKQTHT